MGDCVSSICERLTSWMRHYAIVVLKVGILSLLMLQHAQAAAVSGAIDEFGYSQSHQEIWIKGWIKSDEAVQRTYVFQLRVAGHSYSVKNIIWIDRRGSAEKEAKGAGNLLSSFELSVVLPVSPPSGRHWLDLEAVSNN